MWGRRKRKVDPATEKEIRELEELLQQVRENRKSYEAYDQMVKRERRKNPGAIVF